MSRMQGGCDQDDWSWEEIMKLELPAPSAGIDQNGSNDRQMLELKSSTRINLFHKKRRIEEYLRVQRHNRHDQDQDERPDDEEDVEAAAGARREPDEHQDDERQAEEVAEEGDCDERYPAAAFVVVREPRVVPLVHEVEERDQLDDQEDAGAEAGNLA